MGLSGCTSSRWPGRRRSLAEGPGWSQCLGMPWRARRRTTCVPVSARSAHGQHTRVSATVVSATVSARSAHGQRTVGTKDDLRNGQVKVAFRPSCFAVAGCHTGAGRASGGVPGVPRHGRLQQRGRKRAWEVHAWEVGTFPERRRPTDQVVLPQQ